MNLRMKAKIASIHNKIKILDEQGRVVYRVRSKVLSIHNVTTLTRGDGSRAAIITRKMVSLHDTHIIEMDDGTTVELQSELLHISKDVLNIDVLGWQLLGDVIQHNYQLVDSQGQLLAQAHRKWISLHNTYEIDLLDESQMDLIVAVLVALDKIITDRAYVTSSASTATTSQN